ncbi:MAG: hypothetical protein IPK03_03465 [Bacteroidetes bacterium]|nr:hypothetical protein [Bacteroidota bacterium]
MRTQFDLKKISITFSLTALGLALGSIVSFLKLPIFLDTIGIMLCTLLLGWEYGILASILTAIIAFSYISIHTILLSHHDIISNNN